LSAIVTGWLSGEIGFRHRLGMIDDEGEARRSSADMLVRGFNLSGGRHKMTNPSPGGAPKLRA